MKAKAKKAKASKRVKALKRTIASVACEAILAGATVEGVLNAVKKAFPEAQTGKNSVAWYRSQLRREGERVPDLKAAARGKKAAKPKAAKKAKRAARAARPSTPSTEAEHAARVAA